MALPVRPRARGVLAVAVVASVAVAVLAGMAVRDRTTAAATVVQVAAHGRAATATTPQQPAGQGPGPGPAAVAGVQWTSGSMLVGHLRRAWWLATPTHSRHARLPLLMILHGRGSTPAIEAKRTGFLGVVGAGDAIAVYPAGWDTSWNAGRCCGRAHAAGIDDEAFLRRLATDLQARPDVAPGDLDLVGFSNGAKMAFDLVCTGAIRPRAMAVAEAVPTTGCSHSPPVPLVQVAGTADPLVPYAQVDPSLSAGGVPLTPVLTEVNSWAANNGCTASTVISKPDRQLQTWTGCKAPLTLLTYPGGVHAWQPDATAYLWEFLQAQAGAVT